MQQQNPMLVASEFDARIDGLYRLIKGKIDWDNLVPTCIEAGHELQQMTQLRGKDKLELLQATLKHALKESDKSAEEKEAILHKIDTVVPIIMQAAVISSKLPLKQIQSTCFSCLKK